jgi:hypothetical protein
MIEKQRFELPRVAKLESVEEQAKTVPSPDGEPQKSKDELAQEARVKAQEMWDAFRDIATAWRQFVADHKSEIKQEKQASSESRFDVKSLFFNLEHPLTQEFRAQPIYKRLAKQVAELYRDPAVQQAWDDGMAAHANQWEGVNGTWTEYLQLCKDERVLEQQRDELLREKFDEQKFAPSKRRRTLASDLTDSAIALEALHIRRAELQRGDPDLVAKILARELEERRKELQSKEGFMWFPSRQRIRDFVAEKIAHRTSLRIINLEGEAGTGKTTLARAISRLFTGHEPFKKTCGKKMKADRALFADKDLEAGSSPTFYGAVLKAVTGKERANGPITHDGRAVLLDELNTMENDEARVLATNCDGMHVGQPTGYDSNGTNPDDIVQPHALILGAQNLAGGKFSDRTIFTPEVKRKMDIIQVEYPPLTQDNPELYESLLVALMDGDGRITASKSELAAAWKDDKIFEEGKEYKTEKYDDDNKAGGALWRFAKLLDASYKSFYGKPNVPTDDNPDARLTGEPLTPGDVYAWLAEYRDARKRQQSLSLFLSEKYFTWIDQKFRAESDIGNRELYLQLGEHFGILAKNAASGEHHALPKQRVAFDLLTHRDVAYLSPRVPRKKELIPPPKGGTPPAGEASELKTMTIDVMDAVGQTYEGLTARVVEIHDSRRAIFKNDSSREEYRHIASISECAEQPQFANTYLFESISRPEHKRIAGDITTDIEFLAPEKHIISAESRKNKKDIINPFADIWTENGVTGKEKLEKFEIDLGEMLELCKATYRKKGLDTWADALPQTTAEIIPTDPKQQERYKEYLKEGRIPIFMPPRSMQLDTMASMVSGDQFSHFKPDITTTDSHGATSTTEANDGYIPWDHFRNLMAAKNQTLVAGVPDHWYIMWLQPTQESEYRDESLANQEKYIANKQKEFKDKTQKDLIGGIMPAEYCAFQTLLPEIAREYLSKMEGKNLTSYTPLDAKTYTRFSGVEKSADGSIAVANCLPGNSQLLLNWVVGVPYSLDGVRLLVRD